jgi:hypothetical protein
MWTALISIGSAWRDDPELPAELREAVSNAAQ